MRPSKKKKWRRRKNKEREQEKEAVCFKEEAYIKSFILSPHVHSTYFAAAIKFTVSACT